MEENKSFINIFSVPDYYHLINRYLNVGNTLALLLTSRELYFRFKDKLLPLDLFIKYSDRRFDAAGCIAKAGFSSYDIFSFLCLYPKFITKKTSYAIKLLYSAVIIRYYDEHETTIPSCCNEVSACIQTFRQNGVVFSLHRDCVEMFSDSELGEFYSMYAWLWTSGYYSKPGIFINKIKRKVINLISREVRLRLIEEYVLKPYLLKHSNEKDYKALFDYWETMNEDSEEG